MNRVISKMKDDPLDVAIKHFQPVEQLISKHTGPMLDLYWIGSYEMDIELINYYKALEEISVDDLKKFDRKKNAEAEKIMDFFVAKSTTGEWHLVFFLDTLELHQKFDLIEIVKKKLNNEWLVTGSEFIKIK